MLIGPVRMATIVVSQFNLFLLLIDFTYILLSVVVLSLWCPFSGCLGASLFCDVISLNEAVDNCVIVLLSFSCSSFLMKQQVWYFSCFRVLYFVGNVQHVHSPFEVSVHVVFF